MKPLRIMALLALFTLGACELYFSRDESGRHGPGAPDAGSGGGSGSGYDGGYTPDAFFWPDAYIGNDGGGCCGVPDAGIIVYDGGSAPDCNGH